MNANGNDMHNDHEHATVDAPPMELFDLLADRALQGLDDLEEARLEVLLAENPWVREDFLDEAAASLNVAFEALSENRETLPSSVAEKIRARLQEESVDARMDHAPLGRISPATENTVEHRIGWFGWVGWTAAAAAVIFAASLWQPPVPEIRSATQLVSWVDRHPDAVRWDWAPGLVDPQDEVTGYVTFSPEAQEGYMMIKGLEPNDPRIQQYQLWVWDKDREPDPSNPQPLSENVHPVDGGVFDVNSEGEVVIPIRTPLRVGTPYLFAVTVERPGGVVRSDKNSVPIMAGPANDA